MLDYLLYLIVLVLSLLGLFVGGILSLIAPEELKSGKKYWVFSKYIFILLIVIAILYYSIINSNILTAILLAGAIIFLKLVHKEYFGFVFSIYFASLISEEFLLIIGSLIFIYGLLLGTLQSYDILVKQRRINFKLCVKTMKNILDKNKWYFLLGLILLIIRILY